MLPPHGLPGTADFPITLLDGSGSAFSKYRNRTTVIAVWATFCRPCGVEMPMLESLYRKYQADPNVTLLALSVDDRASMGDVARFAKQYGLTLPVAIDGDRRFQAMLADAMQHPPIGDGHGGPAELALPMFVVIDERGRFYRSIGADPHLSVEQFVREHAGLIEQGISKHLPDDQLAMRRVSNAKSIKLSADTFAEKWPRLRDQLKTMGMTEEQLDRIQRDGEASASRGQEVEIALPL